MAKQVIRRLLPDPHKIQSHKAIKIFGNLLTNPNLWHLNRASAANAVSIGLFVAYIPFVGHMFIAALFAIWFRANLTIAVLLVWVVNPLTMVPMFGAAYYVGAKMLGIAPMDLHFNGFGVCKEIWLPLTIGCIACGGILALCGNLFVRFFWRIQTQRAWRLRRARRLECKA